MDAQNIHQRELEIYHFIRTPDYLGTLILSRSKELGHYLTRLTTRIVQEPKEEL